MWQVLSTNPFVTEAVGAELGRILTPGDVVSLVGDLGAGKTVFVHGVARGLDVRDTVSSPTFLLVQEYEGRYPVFHCDFYRLHSFHELEDIGWNDYLERNGVVLIEWGNRIPEALPEEYLEVAIEQVDYDESTRRIQFHPRGKRFEEKVRELAKRCAYLA